MAKQNHQGVHPTVILAPRGPLLDCDIAATGTLEKVRIKSQTTNSGGASQFDVRINGVTIYAMSGDRPSIASGAAQVTQTGLAVVVTEGDNLTIWATSIPSGGIGGKLTMQVTVEDGTDGNATALQGVPISATPPTNRQILRALIDDEDNITWEAATLSLSGDVVGTYNINAVEKIRGNNVNAGTPEQGQAYVWSLLAGAFAARSLALTHDDLINDLYYGAFARVPTSGELTTARSTILTGFDGGRAALLTAFRNMGHTLFTGVEYSGRGRTDTQFVSDLYLAYLGRTGSAGEIATWVAALASDTRSNIDTAFSNGSELSSIRLLRLVGPSAAAARAANPMTAVGDLIYGGAAGVETRLGIGADGKILKLVAGLPAWADESVGGAVAPFDSTHPDAHPASPNVADDEFDTASLDTGGTRRTGATAWSVVNQSTSTYSQGQSHLLPARSAANSANNVTSFVQTLPGQTFKYRCKMALNAKGADNMAGMILRDSASSKLIMFQLYSASSLTLKIQQYTNSTTVGTTAGSLQQWAMILYLEIEQDATNRKYRYSHTGIEGSYIELYSETKTTFITPDQIGIGINPFGGPLVAGFDWFRRIS